MKSDSETPSSDPAQDQLIEQWSRGHANPVADRVVDEPRPQDPGPLRYAPARPSGGGLGRIVFGIVLLTVGIGVTATTYGAASGGGTYLIAYGPIIYGIVNIVRGLAALGSE